jgi:hypothetical protein
LFLPVVVLVVAIRLVIKLVVTEALVAAQDKGQHREVQATHLIHLHRKAIMAGTVR